MTVLLSFYSIFHGEFEFCEKQELRTLTCPCSQPTFIKLKCELKKVLKPRLVNC